MLHISSGRFIMDHHNQPLPSLTEASWKELDEDMYIDGYFFPEGCKYKVFQTSNFGWLVFNREKLNEMDVIPNKVIFKY